MEPSMQPATADQPVDRKPYVSTTMLADLTASWADNVGSVVIGSNPYGLSVHLSPTRAAELASDLIHAIAESGAGQVPPELLHAFGARDAALLHMGEIAGRGLARGERDE